MSLGAYSGWTLSLTIFTEWVDSYKILHKSEFTEKESFYVPTNIIVQEIVASFSVIAFTKIDPTFVIIGAGIVGALAL